MNNIGISALAWAAVALVACNASTVPSDLGDPCSAEDTALAMTRGPSDFGSERFIPSTSCQSGMCYAPTRFEYQECVERAENSADRFECDITEVIGGPRNHCTIPCEPTFRGQPDGCPAGYRCDFRREFCRKMEWGIDSCELVDRLGLELNCILPDGRGRRTDETDVLDGGVGDAM